MKVTNEKTENRQAFLTIEMEPAEVEESLRKSYRRLANRTDVPGFRRGKVPRAILERYIGKERLFEDALNNLLPEAYEKALVEQKITAYAHPQIEVAQTDPVIFKATVPLLPAIKLGDYHHIQVTPESVKLTKDDVNTAMEQMRHQYASWEPVERTVNFGDLVVLDIESYIEDKPFINRKGAQYQVLQESSFPAPGFTEQLIGMRKDEEKEFKLQFPQDDSGNELAGKEPSFKVKVTEIKQEILPELDDELAKKISPDFKDLASLRERVSTNLRLRAEERAIIDFEERVIDAVVNISECEFPPILVDVEIDRLVNQQLRRWRMVGKGLNDYLGSINKTEEELREEFRPLATKRVNSSLVLGKVAEEEKVEVSDSEIHAEIESMKESTENIEDEQLRFLDTPEARQSVEQMLLTRKTVQLLAEIAKASETNNKTMKKEEHK